MSGWDVLLILAWGLALFNAGRAIGPPVDWPALIVSAVVLIAVPIFGIAAASEDARRG